MRVVTIPISDGELALCSRYATHAELGGSSSVRAREERREALTVDQLVGQVATLGGCKWLYGSAHGHYAYRVGRWAADRAPHAGDDGADVPGSNVDFKGSLIRHPGRGFDLYRLAVRPRERHEGHVYVLALVEPEYRSVYLLGWAADEELPAADSDGVFEGAHTVAAIYLHECMPLRWSL